MALWQWPGRKACSVSWEMFVSLKAHLFKQEEMNIPAERCPARAGLEIKAFTCEEENCSQSCKENCCGTVVMGKFKLYLNNLSLCAALYRCYKHTQLVFKSSPPPRGPGEENYSAVSILTSYLILSTADFGALLVFLNASLCSCTFSFSSVVRNLWKPRAIVIFLHQGCCIPSSLDEGNLC